MTRTVSSADRVSAYARAVVRGRIFAGPHVRAACARHLQDLQDGKSRGLVFDRKAAERALDFFPALLRLNGGGWEGKPYHLLLWQSFVVGSLFGWKGPDGHRRFRVAYIETGKGSGKSPLAAGIGLYGLMADGCPRAEVYAAATKHDQAMVLFRDAVAMVDLSPEIARRIVKSGTGQNVWNLAYLEKGAFFRPISADNGASGPRPHIVLLDEIHEHRTNAVVENLRAGTKQDPSALVFMITNSGSSKTSVAWEYHDYGVKVAAGQIADDSFFAYICALDEGEDPFKSEECWPKANPSLVDGLPGAKYLREQVTQARGMPSKEARVRRLNFCQWTEAANPWIDGEIWFGAQAEPPPPELLRGRKCWGGLDLSSTTDLTAAALLFEPIPIDPWWRLACRFWLPADGLADRADRDRVPYVKWRDDGWLATTPGKVVHKAFVLQSLAEWAAFFDLQAVAYDRWRIEDIKQLASDEGISLPWRAWGQGFKDMAPAIDQFESLLVGGIMRHPGSPVLTWNAANAVVLQDPAGNRKLAKDRSDGRIDGIVASVMAAGATLNPAEQEEELALTVL